MPTYQYACTQCGERLEIVQKFSDEPLTECPACAGTLRKVFSPVGVVFKGSGFYKTDSRTTSKTSSSSPPSDKTETKSSEAATTKSDAGGSGTKSSDKTASGSSSTTTPGQVA
jgi:putative FmdB family regulatory protein